MGTGRLVHLMGTGQFCRAYHLLLRGQVQATDAAGMNPRTLVLFATGPIRKSERIKNPNLKHETRSAIQTLSERLGLGASHSPHRAHGRRWQRRNGPQRWIEWKGRNGNGRNADAVLAKTPNRVAGAV
jgi:hypothetical protein